MKVLMVCLGNICRSPLAEGIMRHHAALAGLDWTIDSAGTGAWHTGEPPHRLSQKVARHHGIDISEQRARQFEANDMLEFDRIFFMDRHNMQDAQQIAGNHWNPEKASLLMDVLYPGQLEGVPDPYYGGEEDYQKVFQMLTDACTAIITSFQSPQ